MATPEQVTQLRRLTGYTDTDPYDDVQLAAMIDSGNIYLVAVTLWEEKAAALSGLVNTSESGSSRNMGDAYKNALAMALHFKKLSDDLTTPVAAASHARTRNIVRESA